MKEMNGLAKLNCGIYASQEEVKAKERAQSGRAILTMFKIY
jgi:hypothetical protein